MSDKTYSLIQEAYDIASCVSTPFEDIPEHPEGLNTSFTTPVTSRKRGEAVKKQKLLKRMYEVESHFPDTPPRRIENMQTIKGYPGAPKKKRIAESRLTAGDVKVAKIDYTVDLTEDGNDEILQDKSTDQSVKANDEVEVIDLTGEDDDDNEDLVPTTVDTIDTPADQPSDDQKITLPKYPIKNFEFKAHLGNDRYVTITHFEEESRISIRQYKRRTDYPDVVYPVFPGVSLRESEWKLLVSEMEDINEYVGVTCDLKKSLGNGHYLHFSEFRHKQYICIRKFSDSGEPIFGKYGINLRVSEWEKLCHLTLFVNDSLQRMREKAYVSGLTIIQLPSNECAPKPSYQFCVLESGLQFTSPFRDAIKAYIHYIESECEGIAKQDIVGKKKNVRGSDEEWMMTVSVSLLMQYLIRKKAITHCLGCEDDQPNQLAHFDGCMEEWEVMVDRFYSSVLFNIDIPTCLKIYQSACSKKGFPGDLALERFLVTYKYNDCEIYSLVRMADNKAYRFVETVKESLNELTPL